MNAPEKIPSLRNEIAQHLADVGEATAKQLAEALIQDRLAVAHTLNDMVKDAEVEREKKRGNEYVYWLSAAGAAPKQEAAKPVKRERVLTPEAEAERDQFEAVYGRDGNCSCHISPPCGSCMHPGNPRSQEEDETAWMDAPAEEPSQPLSFATSPELQYLAPEDYETAAADQALLAIANRELADQIEEKNHTLRSQARVLIDLRAQVSDQGQSIDSLTKDIINTRAALNKAINEADRLRAELATERQAREALQEQDDAVDVTEAAVGYLVRAPKRKPRLVTKPERAREAALAAVRAGAGRAEVLAVVPVGVARRGAEWQESGPRSNGD